MKSNDSQNMWSDDYLKPLDKVFQQDVRSGMLVHVDTGDPVDLEWHYRQISEIELSEDVHEDIKVQFETAKNAYLYSWFSYRLAMLAWSQAFSTLELALRLAAETQGVKVTTISRLLEKASKENWIDFDKFIRTETVQDYIEILRKFRNDMSHGSHMLLSPGMILPFLNDCAEMINQLFEKELLVNKGKSIREGWC